MEGVAGMIPQAHQKALVRQCIRCPHISKLQDQGAPGGRAERLRDVLDLVGRMWDTKGFEDQTVRDGSLDWLGRRDSMYVSEKSCLMYERSPAAATAKP